MVLTLFSNRWGAELMLLLGNMDKYVAHDFVSIIDSIKFRLFYHQSCLMQGEDIAVWNLPCGLQFGSTHQNILRPQVLQVMLLRRSHMSYRNCTPTSYHRIGTWGTLVCNTFLEKCRLRIWNAYHIRHIK